MSRIRPTCLEFFTTPGRDLLCSGPIRTPQRDLTILPDIQIESANLLPNYVYRTIVTVFLHQILKWGKFLVFLPHKNCLNKLTKVTLVHKTFVKSGRLKRERSGSVVECLTRDRRAAGSSLTGVTALWSLSKTHLS